MSSTPEQKITRRVIRALKEAGTPVTSVWDTEENTPVAGEAEIMALADNLDELWLCTGTGSWVRIVNGNEWDALVDYTLSLEPALEPVNEWISTKW